MRLIVSATCPYAQRAWIAVHALQLDCEIEMIDLKHKPEWFLKLTPFAQVPVLIDDQQRVLWESMVIVNYLNQLNGSPLSPQDAFINAVNEAWIQRVAGCMSVLSAMAAATNTTELAQTVAQLQQQFHYFEHALQHAPYFNGQQFCVIDILYAPIFLRVEVIAQHHKIELYAKLPKVAAWAKAVLANSAVKQSIVQDFAKIYSRRFLF